MTDITSVGCLTSKLEMSTSLYSPWESVESISSTPVTAEHGVQQYAQFRPKP